MQEYFQSQLEYSREKINEMAVTRCVNVFIVRASMESDSGDSLELSTNPRNFVNYASFHWPYHCDASGGPSCRGKVKQFLFQESGIALRSKFGCHLLKHIMMVQLILIGYHSIRRHIYLTLYT